MLSYNPAVIQTRHRRLLKCWNALRCRSRFCWLQTEDMKVITSWLTHRKRVEISDPCKRSGKPRYSYTFTDTGRWNFWLYFVLNPYQEANKRNKSQPHKYRFLTNKTVCDFLDPIENPFYTLHFRVLRFPITESTMECIITNLEEEDFPMKEIKNCMNGDGELSVLSRIEIYDWINEFPCKKVEYILQEILPDWSSTTFVKGLSQRS